MNATPTVDTRLTFSPRAEAFWLRDAPPHVAGYAWRHASPTASIVLLHGLQSHARWFAEAADMLNDRGFAVYALDRRGSGSSPGRRGDIRDYRHWYDEVRDVVAL